MRLIILQSIVCNFYVYTQGTNGKYFFPQVFFDEEDAKNRLQEGNSTIRGVLFHAEGSIITKTKYYGKKQTVVLFPYTSYFSEWYNLKYQNPRANIILRPEVFRYRLEAQTDEYGNFTFNKMKPGKYYLESSIDYIATGVGHERVATIYYNAYWSQPIYESYYYNYDVTKIANKRY